ncbi:hypothetical protein E2C01_052582 [Portunus trituberculatus]|uniref:Uncharacterized protein n=1 Tax=Portunus trituberculatus TaxID=210409 RepID=A0A5B7GPR8_PORTR|nr:hypothetical protein [Portunus trituberculatus]
MCPILLHLYQFCYLGWPSLTVEVRQPANGGLVNESGVMTTMCMLLLAYTIPSTSAGALVKPPFSRTKHNYTSACKWCPNHLPSTATTLGYTVHCAEVSIFFIMAARSAAMSGCPAVVVIPLLSVTAILSLTT